MGLFSPNGIPPQGGFCFLFLAPPQPPPRTYRAQLLASIWALVFNLNFNISYKPAATTWAYITLRTAAVAIALEGLLASGPIPNDYEASQK